MSSDEMIMGADRIMQLLPHRYPFLLIDKIVDVVAGESITAVKNVTINEPYFTGHFPGNPVMPGVLIIEAMAQAGGVLSHVTAGSIEPKPLYYLVAVDEARFRKPVVPGDQLVITVRVDRVIRGMWRYDCSASVDGGVVVSARIMCAPGGKQ
jgi:3-hydroxyacyl-[acyl-carrier-protein] dehydratase